MSYANSAPVVVDKRQRLAQISHRKVRIVAGESNEFAAALIDVAKERRIKWEFAEWQEVLDELDSSDLTIGAWLEREARR